jgi:DNA modification methylase
VTKADPPKNMLYFGDNLPILKQHIADESVDLIYLDPPFNSKATYNVLFQEKTGLGAAAQIKAFEDTWHWDEAAAAALNEVVTTGGSRLVEAMRAFQAMIPASDMLAYLSMMAARLIQLHRVLKPTGSIYLHCDPTASHYLKILMDATFGAENFRNEIIWRRTGSNNSADGFGPIHQSILFYVKSNDAAFYYPKGPYTKDYIEKFFRFKDERGRFRAVLLTGPGTREGDSGQPWRNYNPTSSGRHWQPASYLYDKYRALTGEDLASVPLIQRLDKLDSAGLVYWGKGEGNVPQYKLYLDDVAGVPYQDVWAYQPGTKGCVYGDDEVGIDQDVKWLTSEDAERLGYPTQKPVGLLARIIRASSKEGDTVLDPFCGCGTTIDAAQRLNRRWIGIDITYLAIGLVERRLKDTHTDSIAKDYEVIGSPTTVPDARELARRDRFQFEWWALDLIDARPMNERKKGADRGVDGRIDFQEHPGGPIRSILIQVKSGGVDRSHIATLKGDMSRGFEMGALVTLEEPTGPMIREATDAGVFTPEDPIGAGRPSYPKVQIRTIKQILEEGMHIDYPRYGNVTFKQAARAPARQRGRSTRLTDVGTTKLVAPPTEPAEDEDET